MADRSFGGYAYQQRLGTGVFGELYRALSAAGKEARILHVDPRLAARPAFARALIQFGERMVPLDHPRVAALRHVGRSGDHLVVVTDPVSGPVTLRDLIARCGGRLPPDIALAIARGAIEGLAFAHSLRVVHGAVHPRSVLIDFHGEVVLGDFGVAWALVASSAETGDVAPLRELTGYLAPELALGQTATELGDVYAAGALLFELLSGRPPPGELPAPPALRRVVERALAVQPRDRLVNGTELEELLEEAIAADGCPVAPATAVAHLVAERLAASDDALRSETEDLLSGLAADADGDVPIDATEVDPTSRLHGQLDLSGLLRLNEIDAHSEPARQPALQLPAAARPPGPALAGRVVVDDEEDRTPLPHPAPHRPGSVTRHLDALEGGEGSAPRTGVRRPRALWWMAATAFALAALATVVYTRTDLVGPGPRADEERAAEKARKEALARHEAAQPLSAELTVTAAEPDAAVWLLLGRTPIDSLPLSAAMVHEMRVEHEGYRPHDVRVTGYQWKQEGGSLRARVVAELVPGGPRSPVPAFPPAAKGAAPPAGPAGRGVVRVESDPSGAQVWLLIGFTPRATIAGLVAGRDYQLKVLKDGFRPGFAAVRAEDWFLSGPGGPMLTSQAREVALTRQSGRRGQAKGHGRGRGGEPRGKSR